MSQRRVQYLLVAAALAGVCPPPAIAGEPAISIEVHESARVLAAARANPWLRDMLEQPLGRGLIGPWAAFLGASGTDLKASFAETVLDLAAGRLLATPWRVVWFAGAEASSSPALVVSAPAAAARSAFAALDAVAGREVPEERCPGAGAGAAEAITLRRLTLAEHTVYAAIRPDRLVFGRDRVAVRDGVCMDLGDGGPPSAGTDLAVAFAPERLGRETQLLAHLLGLGPAARLELVVTQNRLVPRGIAADLADPGRLDVAPVGRDLLRLLPEETPVVLALTLRLPTDLEGGALERWIATGGASDLDTRQALLAWTPRGDPHIGSEVALIWSRPRDRCALERVFAGGNSLATGVVGGSLVLASSADLLERIEKTQAGKRPSLLHAAPEVVSGLRARTSLGVGLQFGRLLSQLVADGHAVDLRERNAGTPPPGPAPPEIERARRGLEALPFLGFRGVLTRGRLAPRGYRS